MAVCVVWGSVSSGTMIYLPSTCDWALAVSVCVWAWVCEMVHLWQRAVIYVNQSWSVSDLCGEWCVSGVIQFRIECPL